MRDTVVTGRDGPRLRPQPPARPLLRTTLGHLLRRARRQQNRTLADVARAARVSLPYLSELERGRKEASSEILAAVCGALRIELSDLLAEAGRSLAADRARRALIEERARRRAERAGQRAARLGEPAGETAAMGGSGQSGGLPGPAPTDVPVVVPLDAVRGHRVPGPGHGSGHTQARLAA
ncbi:MAG: helix-turn-helix domain-containing protein [Streptosporangiaceae bacterium]